MDITAPPPASVHPSRTTPPHSIPVSGRDVLIRAIAGQWRHNAVGVMGAVGHQTGEALVPVLIGVVIDRAVAGGDVRVPVGWIAALAAVFVVLSFSYRWGARAAERASESAAHEIRGSLTARILDPRGGAQAGRLPGALVSVATADAKRVGSVNLALVLGIAALTGLLTGGIALLLVSPVLGAVILLGAPPSLWLAHLLGRPLQRRSGEQQERAAQASGVAADLITGLRVLKGIGAEPAAVARYRRTSGEALAATLRAAGARAGHEGATIALTGILIAVVALIGGRLAARGDLGIGDLVAAVGLAQFLLGPLSGFARVNAEFAQSRASAARVAELLSVPPAVIPGASRLPERIAGRVRLRHLTQGPLRDVDLEIGPGEHVGIVARDPAAALALVHCLGRDLDPAAGAVELDGLPLRGLHPADIRGAIVVAPHDADLFEGTVLDNVGAHDAGALAAAGVDEVVRSLPAGGGTHVAERGRSLSGGQRQRIALARALATDPPVLVVHDPTTAVDAVTETRIAAGLRAVRRGRTTIVVADSPALLAVTDRVALLAEGTVAAEGTHTGLLREHDGYRADVLS